MLSYAASVNAAITGKKFPRGFRDVYNGPNGFRSMSDYDRERADDLMELVDHPASGVMAAYIPGATHVLPDARADLGLTIEHRPNRMLPLWEVVKDAQTVTITPSTRTDDGVTLQIKTEYATHRVVVDPQHDYLISKIATTRADNSATSDKTVTEFAKLPSGKFFAKRVTTKIGPVLNLDAEVSVLAVNELPEDAFDMTFPKGLIVYDRDADQPVLWGDGEPQRRFVSDEEYKQWDAERQIRHMDSAQGNGQRWTMATFAMLGLFAIFLYVRRQNSQATSR